MTFGKTLKHYLLTGLFILGPVSLAILLLFWFIAAIDATIARPLEGLVNKDIPGLGMILAITLLIVTGFLASNIMGQHILEWIEELLLKIPVFNWFYKMIKQITDTFSPNSRMRFKSVVLVEYPMPGVYSVGFVTNRLKLKLTAGKPEFYACVYVPSNHLYLGNFFVLPKKKLIPTELTLQQGIESVLSAGAGLPRNMNAGSKKALAQEAAVPDSE